MTLSFRKRFKITCFITGVYIDFIWYSCFDAVVEHFVFFRGEILNTLPCDGHIHNLGFWVLWRGTEDNKKEQSICRWHIRPHDECKKHKKAQCKSNGSADGQRLNFTARIFLCAREPKACLFLKNCIASQTREKMVEKRLGNALHNSMPG